MKNKLYTISLGGSLIFPQTGIDWKFLKNFRELIISEIKKGNKFILVTGGGSLARQYQEASIKITKLTNDDRDWLGVHATRMNAHLLKTIFRQHAHPRINKNPRTNADLKSHFKNGESIMIAAGWRPGWSTDYVATILAERLNSKTLINLSNIDYVYDKDPSKFNNAKKIKEISWTDFRKIVGNKWDPGLNAPFDPIASQLAQENKMSVIIANGKKLKNLQKIFREEKFIGTVIK